MSAQVPTTLSPELVNQLENLNITRDFETDLRHKYKRQLTCGFPFQYKLITEPFVRQPELSLFGPSLDEFLDHVRECVVQSFHLSVPDDVILEIGSFVKQEVFVKEYQVKDRRKICHRDFLVLSRTDIGVEPSIYPSSGFLFEFYMTFQPARPKVPPKFDMWIEATRTRFSVVCEVGSFLNLSPTEFQLQSRMYRNSASSVFTASFTTVKDSYNFYPHVEDGQLEHRIIFDVLPTKSLHVDLVNRMDTHPRMLAIKSGMDVHTLYRTVAWMYDWPAARLMMNGKQFCGDESQLELIKQSKGEIFATSV